MKRYVRAIRGISLMIFSRCSLRKGVPSRQRSFPKNNVALHIADTAGNRGAIYPDGPGILDKSLLS
jgi:hypothetical protein